MRRRERFSVYKQLRTVLQQVLKEDNDYHFWLTSFGFCHYLKDIDPFYEVEDFPELMEYEPEVYAKLFWFPVTRQGLEKRLSIINEIIKNEKNENKQALNSPT